MRRRIPFGIVVLVCVALLIGATPAVAQRGGGHRAGPVHPRVSIGLGFGFGPYYGPYYYGSWFYSQFWPYPGYPYGYPYYYSGRGGASIRVQVQPKFAQVYVDGNLAGIVDEFDGFLQSLTVEPGGHDITIYLEGYRSIVQRMYLSPGSSYRIKGVMEKLAAGEPNEPRPQPSPEARRIRQRYPGQPYPGQPYPGQDPGDVSQPAAPPIERQPQEAYPPIVREAPAPVDREPAPAPPSDARFGQVAIRVQPADAQITIDGEPWRGPEGADRLVVHLRAGTHRIEIRKEGFDPFVTAVEIKRGEVAVLNVSLARL